MTGFLWALGHLNEEPRGKPRGINPNLVKLFAASCENRPKEIQFLLQ